jgi:hypothetical protein
MDIHTVALVDKGANRKKFFLLKREVNPVNKEFIVSLVKSAKMSADAAFDLAKTAGMNETDCAVVKAAGVQPAPAPETSTVSKSFVISLVKAIKLSSETALDLAKAIGLDDAGQKEVAAAGTQKAAGPSETATEAEKVAWYIANPDAEIPDNMQNAVATALAEQKAKELDSMKA